MIASSVVLPFDACPCLTKKLTVIGTIGQTHGITRASSPAPIESNRNGMIPCSSDLCTASVGGEEEGVCVPEMTAGVRTDGSGAGPAEACSCFTSAGAVAVVAASPPGSTVSTASGRVQRPGCVQLPPSPDEQSM